jgi:hypothetical protein
MCLIRNIVMKKNIVLFFIIFSSAYATDISQSENITSHKSNFTYLKMGGSLIPNKNGYDLAPMIFLGNRFQRASHAIDLSFGGARYDKNSYFILPKIMYLYYFTPDLPTSFYAGGGLSCGRIKNHEEHKMFKGILGEAAVGYEWIKTSSISSFVELTLSQSAIPLGERYHHMPPLISLGFGVGF